MSWFEHFFEGLATDVWRESISAEETAAEAEFLVAKLQVYKGARLLDVPCADGRLALPLAQYGMEVTGVDLSDRCLSAAKQDARDKGISVNYIRADMRDMQLDCEYDGAFCMGNSFAYFNSHDSLSFLKRVYESLKPGAGFVLDTCLAAETFFTVGGQREWTEVAGIYMLMENHYEPKDGSLHSRFVFMKNGTIEEHNTTHWIFTTGQICAMLEDVGFRVNELLSSIDNDQFELGSDRLLICATKPAV